MYIEKLNQEEREIFFKQFMSALFKIKTSHPVEAKKIIERKIPHAIISRKAFQPKMKPRPHPQQPQFKQPLFPANVRIGMGIIKPSIKLTPKTIEAGRPQLSTPNEMEMQQMQSEVTKDISQYVPSISVQPREAMALEFGKISNFLDDASINSIECLIGETVKLEQEGRKTETQIILRKDEIEDIIRKFSQKTKIPIIDNFFKALYKDWQINAIISDIIGSRIVLTKNKERKEDTNKEENIKQRYMEGQKTSLEQEILKNQKNPEQEEEKKEELKTKPLQKLPELPEVKEDSDVPKPS